MTAEVNKEIEAMLNALGDKTPEGSSVDEEEEKEEQEKSEEKQEEKEEEKEEEKKEDFEQKEEEKEETKEEEKAEEKEEEEEEVEEDKDKIIEDLRARLNEKSGEPEKASPKEEKEEKKEEAKEEPLNLAEQDFIGESDVEDIVRDKASFNKLLNTVYAKGVADSKKISTEGVLRTIPDMIKHNVELLSALRKAGDEFYEANKDLVPYKKVVAAVFEEIAAKNPDKNYRDLMKDVAPEARKRLALHNKAVEADKESNPPRLPGKKTNQRQVSNKPKTSSIENEISLMNKSLGR